MASAAVERPSAIGGFDDQTARAVRESRRAYITQKAAQPSSSSARPGDGYIDAETHDAYVSPDSDAGSQEDEVARRPGVQGSPTHHSRSPPRQRPLVPNAAPGPSGRDQWAPSSPSSRQRPPSYSGEDERRFSTGGGASGGGRYRRDKPSTGTGTGAGAGAGSRPPSGSSHPPFSSAGPWPKTNRPAETSRSAGTSHHRRSQPSVGDARGARGGGPPAAPEHLNPPSPGRSQEISRLESPSIAKSVLNPLEKKMAEYDRLMDESQADMVQLDDELRVLQERRRHAEERFLEAKSKHDDYERQHQDVERALRGEVDGPLSSAAPLPPPVRQASSQPFIRPYSAGDNLDVRHNNNSNHPGLGPMDGYDRRPVSNQTSKNSSRARKMGMGDRIRRSLFGNL